LTAPLRAVRVQSESLPEVVASGLFVTAKRVVGTRVLGFLVRKRQSH
jgi:hypothetical protein